MTLEKFAAIFSGRNFKQSDGIGMTKTLRKFDTAARVFVADTAHRYRQFGDAMSALEKHETAAVFRQLEAMERDVSQAMFGPADIAPPGLGDAAWGNAAWGSAGGLWVGDDDDLLPADIADSVYSLTPVRAINLALHNNQRAVQFITNVLARTEDDRAPTLAERFHHTVLDQMVCLRLERRRACRRQKVSLLDENLALLLEPKKDMESYSRGRDICLRQLRDRVTLIARSASEEERHGMLRLAAAIFPSPPHDMNRAEERPVEGNAVARAIATIESVFDALLLTARQSEEEAVLRLAQDDAKKLLPALRRLRGMTN
jgi:hypothetical protein